MTLEVRQCIKGVFFNTYRYKLGLLTNQLKGPTSYPAFVNTFFNLSVHSIRKKLKLMSQAYSVYLSDMAGLISKPNTRPPFPLFLNFLTSI